MMSTQIVRDMCEKRLADLKLDKNKEYTDRLIKEINAIQNQDMSFYLLDCAEKVKTQGKIKNSNHMLVTFLLGISDEDPIKEDMELIKTKYEEFPDIDSDFEDCKRDLVKKHMIEKYGEGNVAGIIAFGKNKAKNTIKDIGRVKNIPFEEINEVTKHLHGGPQPDTIEDGYNKSETVRDFFDRYKYLNLYNVCRKVEGNVRQPTKHAAGVVISPVPLVELVGLQKVGKEVCTCWEEGIENKELSKVGLVKLDILGLSTLTVLNETIKYIRRLHGVDIDISELDLEDVNVLKGFYDANTVGIFQFEKAELRNLMKKIKISCFSDISAINALNRPGPLDTGMDEVFWKVKNGKIKTQYLHPKLEPILKDTYTVMCIAKGSHVYTKNGLKEIQTIQNDEMVLTHDGTYQKVLKNINNGRRRTTNIRISNGEELFCTGDHLILTSQGWKYTRNLKKGDLIKSFWSGEEKLEIGDDKDWLLGLALADGDLTSGTPNIACGKKIFAEKIKKIADKAFDLNCHIYFNTRCWYVSLRKNNNIHYKSRDYEENKFTKMIKDLGLRGKTSYTKFLPQNYTLSTIAGFIEGDGCLLNNTIRIKNKKMAYQIYLALQSYRIHSSYFNNKDVNTITFKDEDNKLPFRIKKNTRQRRGGIFIPKSDITFISKEFEKNQRFSRIANNNSYVSKNLLDITGCKYNHGLWSRVLNIKQKGLRNVYDLSVENNHNYVVGGLVVHNCYQEQIIKIFQDLGGYSADEADNFRRVLTKDAQAGRSKGINPLEKYEKQFIQNCMERGVTGRVVVHRDIYDDAELPITAKDVKVEKEVMNENTGEAYNIISCNVEVSDEIFHQMKSFAGYGFNKCLTGDVKVRFDDYSSLKISTIFVNKHRYLSKLPSVISYNEDANQILPNRIQDVVESGIQDVYILTTKSRKHISCTANHKIRTNNGWKELGQVGVSDKILVFKGAELSWDDIITIKYKGKEMTYDVSLEDQTHPYFFANNIGVHNSHSTAYAYLAFQSMYLKTYFPKEFMSVLLTYTPNTVDLSDNTNYFISYVEEARRMNIDILPPDINKSMKEFTISEDNLLSGFTFLKGVGDNPIKEIISKRPFKSVKDFLMKVDARKVNKTAFNALVHCGAFDQFLENKDIAERYQFINEFLEHRKKSKKAETKNLEVKYSYVQAVEKESEVCGGEIFNSPLKGLNIKEINKRFEVDEKIVAFKELEKIDVGSIIRVFGKVEKFSVHTIGFVDVKNGLDKKTFLLWQTDLEKLERKNYSNKKMLLSEKAVITFLVKRNKDYNGKKSFIMDVESIESMENLINVLSDNKK